ncbi:Uncharacterised protein g8472 [Pycnogonum litorale]
MSSLKKSPFLYEIQGIENCPVMGTISPTLFKESLTYEPDDSDLFVASYPKCGTTWTRMIVWLLMNDIKEPDSFVDLGMKNYLEYFSGREAVENSSKPREIKTHLPFNWVPYNPKSKYIYVSRNPFDCCVSYYHHCRSIPLYDFEGSFDDYFEHFIRGKVEYGDYFSHVTSWYAHRNDENMLFIVYEDMKKDPATAIRQMGNFIGGKPAELVKDAENVQRIIEFSSFRHMKDLETKSFKEDEDHLKPEGTSDFIRKGQIGDYKNVMSDSQYERMNEKYQGWMKGTTLMEKWRNYVTKIN